MIVLHCMTAVLAASMALTGCSTPAGLVFADRDWHVSSRYGQIIDKDSTYRMTFGNILIPDPLAIVSSADSVAKYPGMDRFVADILHTARLDSAEILFYAPQMLTMFVIPKETTPPGRPSSITSPMSGEKPYTMWINEKDVELWKRDQTEMYTYTYFDKGKKQLLIVDFYDYGDIPVAQITIFQSKNKTTEKMNVPESVRRSFFELHDVKNFMRDIEFWSDNVNSHRSRAIANYKIGREQKAPGSIDKPSVNGGAQSH